MTLPMAVEPVALMSGTRGSSTIATATSRPQMMSWLICSGTSCPALRKRAAAFSRIFWQASATSGVLSDGFQMTGLPQTKASAAFHAHTATGKLKAVMTPHGPIGCQTSRM